MKLLFASHNRGKIDEAKSILAPVSIITPFALDDNTEVPETGATLHENAYIKADYYFGRYNIPVFADDTGLIVPALNDAPGIYSARYAGADATYDDNNKLLLANMKGITDRKAYFLTVICYIDERGNTRYFSGRLSGLIHHERRGQNGFGYDPLFFLPGLNKTLAELGPEIKNLLSHRYQALSEFSQFLKGALKWKNGLSKK